MIIWSEAIYLDALKNRSWDQFLKVSWLVLLFNETIAVASGKIDLIRPENYFFICYKIISVMI